MLASTVLATRKPSKQALAKIAGAEVRGPGLLVRYAPLRGYPQLVEDFIGLSPDGELDTVASVGRFLRILRAGRIRAPADPYALHRDLEEAVALVRRCEGATVQLTLERRMDRSLSVWTESGVEQIANVVDCVEDSGGLSVRRRGGQSILYIPRESMIRYELASTERYQVTSLDVPR